MVERWQAREITTKSSAFKEQLLWTRLKTLTESWPCSIIQTATRRQKPKRNSKRYPKHTLFCQILRNEDNTILWGTKDSTNATREKIFSEEQTSIRFSGISVSIS